MKVFAVFGASGEGDGWTVFELIGLAATQEGALRLTSPVDKDRIDRVHPLMSETNNFTVFAKRDECKHECCYNHDGGWCIEEMDVSVPHVGPTLRRAAREVGRRVGSRLRVKKSERLRCLADVNGCLCVVEIEVTFLEVKKP